MTAREYEPRGPLYFDRTVQNWHYSAFGKDDDAIDIDLLGACHFCRAPLYLIEATTNPDKPTTILQKLAEPGHVPVFIVWYKNGEVTKGRQVFPARGNILYRTTLEFALSAIRSSHECEEAR